VLRERWVLVLFVAVAALHLLPVLRVELIPTVDGPSHVYNAQVLRELAKGTQEFARVFAVNTRLNPNWLGHLVLMASSEKVLFGAIVLLFLSGCWRLGGAWAFLAMPLSYHLLLQMGFYNYALAVALSLHAIASWWRGERIWITSLWMFFCALAHPLPVAVAVVFIGIAWLMGDDRRWIRLIPLIAPILIVGIFLLRPEHPGGTWTWKGALLFQPLLRVILLYTFEPRQIVFGTVLGVIYGLLIIATIAIDGWKARPAFAVLTIAAIAMYLAAPVSEQEGLVLKARLLIFPFVIILPWLTPRLLRAPLIIALALVATANVFYLRACWKESAKVMQRAIEPFAAAQPNRTLIALMRDRAAPNAQLLYLWHVVSYAAARHHLIDLGDYEASMAFFPVVYRPNVRRPSMFDLETWPPPVDPTAYAPDYIYTWKYERSFDGYKLIASHGDARLYQSTASTLPSNR
jgi:hypothetical protein